MSTEGHVPVYVTEDERNSNAVMHKINKPVCAGNFAQYKARRMSIEGHVPVYVTKNE